MYNSGLFLTENKKEPLKVLPFSLHMLYDNQGCRFLNHRCLLPQTRL